MENDGWIWKERDRYRNQNGVTGEKKREEFKKKTKDRQSRMKLCHRELFVQTCDVFTK